MLIAESAKTVSFLANALGYKNAYTAWVWLEKSRVRSAENRCIVR